MKEMIFRTSDDGIVMNNASEIELVRCKDCVNSGTSRCPCHYSGDPYIDWEPDGDWFCADGERKSADEKLMEEMDADPLG